MREEKAYRLTSRAIHGEGVAKKLTLRVVHGDMVSVRIANVAEHIRGRLGNYRCLVGRRRRLEDIRVADGLWAGTRACRGGGSWRTARGSWRTASGGIGPGELSCVLGEGLAMLRDLGRLWVWRR